MRIFKKLGWQRAWITLPFFVLGSSFLFSFFRSPIRPFSGPVFWVNAIWTLVFWIWIHQVFEELIHFFGRSFWGKSVLYFLIGSFALLSSFCFLLNTGLYLSQGEFLTSHMLRFIQSEPNYLKIFARDYIGGMEIGFWAVGVGLLFKYWKNSVFHHPFLREIRVRRVSFFLISVILILSYNWVDKFTNSRQRTLDLATVSSVSQLYSSRWSSGKKLHAAHREKLHSLEGADLPNLDIILVIVESWGKQGLQAYGNGQGLMPFWRRGRLGNLIPSWLSKTHFQIRTSRI